MFMSNENRFTKVYEILQMPIIASKHIMVPFVK